MTIKLMFTGKYSSSIPQKVIIILCLLTVTFLSGWYMFFETDVLNFNGNIFRKFVIFTFAIIYTLRIIFTLFVFLKRKIPWWESFFGVFFLPLVLFYFIYISSQNSQLLNVVDFIGIFLYFFGSYLNTRSELDRHRWKLNPANSGYLYAHSLFKYARHINYFGDILLFAGFALVTQKANSLVVPLIMGLNFVFILIPAKETYLRGKYGQEFEKYCNKTSKLVPWIY